MTRTKAYGYTRLSQKSDTSIEKQKQYIEQYCEEHSLELVDIFDDGEKSSGYEDQREEYQEMLKQIREDDVGAIVVRDRTRFGRDKLERMQRFIELYRQGVDIHIQKEDAKVDFEGDFDLVKESFHAEKDDVAKREEIEKAKEAIQERQEQGYYQGRPPFGLQFGENKRHLVPDDDFDIALRVIDLREDGSTYREIKEVTGVGYSTAYRIVDRRDLYEDTAQKQEAG